VTVAAPFATVKVKLCEAAKGPAPVELSVAVIVNGNEPAAVGVPVIAPEPLSDKPVGKAPLVTAYVYEGVPPEAETLWL
jgi:hypothetical protein